MSSLLDTLQPESRARIQRLLDSQKWALPGDHPIARLDGLRLGDRTTIALLGPKNSVGSRYFQLFLARADGQPEDDPLALGLQNSGPYPAFNWIELTQWREIGDANAALFAALRTFAPPGGHIMAEYDSPTHRATERMLTLRYPPATSPIGYLMFEQGIRSYRDWYISEGGREGPRKLQGFVPLSNDIAAEKTAALRREIEAMLAAPEQPGHGEWGQLARELGTRALAAL